MRVEFTLSIKKKFLIDKTNPPNIFFMGGFDVIIVI